MKFKIFNESPLVESKEDIQKFVDKFGQKTYDDFIKAKDRLKNKNLSTDIVWHVKNTSPDEMQNLLVSLYDKNRDEQKKRQVQGTDKEIRGKYKYLGTKGGYAVYEPLDVYASMDLGVNTGWCTTGRYGHYGHPEFTPSLKDAKEHWNDYINRGIRFFYFLDPSTMYGKYAVALYPNILEVDKVFKGLFVKSANIEIYNAKDELDYSISANLPLDLIPKEIVIEGEQTTQVEGLTILDNEVIGAEKTVTDVVIPNGVTAICRGVFYHCTSLISVTIPNSVMEIESESFARCDLLTSVTIPNSVTKIGKGAFHDCTSLTSITIPNSVTEIRDFVFYNCSSLTSVTIPNSVVKIGNFAFSGCTSLTSVTIPNSVMGIESLAFSSCTSLTILCHKDSYAEQYAKENNIPVKLIESNQVHNNKMRFKLVEGKNLETTVNQYKDKVKKALANDRAFILDVERYKQLDGIDDPEDAAAKEWVKSILEIDPTYQEGSNTTGLYGTFILNQYIKDPDMDTIAVTELLKKFDENKRFLDNKDINSYKDWDEIIDALANKSVSARQAERIARHANSKIKKVWENENWVVYSPLNYEGALTLGRGSSWCTSDSRTAKFYVQYALGDIHAEMDYDDVAELQDSFFEDEDHQLDLEDNGYPTTKEEILKEYSNRAVIEFCDDGFFIYNPYDLDGSDYIYDIINKGNNSIKYQLALADGFYDYGFDNDSEGGCVIANIHDNIFPNIEKVVEMHPDLRAFFEDELEIKLNIEDEE